MEPQADGGADDISTLKDLRQQLEESISTRRQTQLDLLSSLHHVVPDLISSLDVSLRLISAFNGRQFSPTPVPNTNPNHTTAPDHQPLTIRRRRPLPDSRPPPSTRPKPSPPSPGDSPSAAAGGDGDRLSIVRTMVAVCLLELVPFNEFDSSALLRRLESDQSSATSTEKAALAELGGDLGPLNAVEMALRRIAEENGGVQLEEFSLTGKSMVMIWAIDRNKLLKELPESSGQLMMAPPPATPARETLLADGATQMPLASATETQRQSQEMWMGPHDPHLTGMPPIYPRAGGPPPMVGPRLGPGVMGIMGMPRMMGYPPLQRPLLGPAMGSQNQLPPKPKVDEEEKDIEKEIEELVSKKTHKEKQQSRTGEEILDLIHRPTAKETATAAKFKTKGGSQLKEYCTNLTKEDCRRQSGSYVACEKVHFRRIIAAHTDTSLGDCSFLDTCRHTKTCKYVHYELDQTPDISPMMMGSSNLTPPKHLKMRRAEYCSEVELGESQWINCDIRSFRMDILGQFGVIMADPPWDIHMELPYGTMADDEMRNLNVPALQTDGMIFLWVTGRAMELGRECLELWGYKRVEEIIWVKTNQLQRIIRTGRTGHWLNHSKEHCLVGLKGNPEVNRNIDTDVVVAEVRETSRKPDEMYAMLERISPRTRKLELFARMHNTHAGWLSLGNQLNGVRLVDEGLRARFKAAYPDVEVQPASPPRTSNAMDMDTNAGGESRNPFAGSEVKQRSTNQFIESASPGGGGASESKPIPTDVEAAA